MLLEMKTKVAWGLSIPNDCSMFAASKSCHNTECFECLSHEMMGDLAGIFFFGGDFAYSRKIAFAYAKNEDLALNY